MLGNLSRFGYQQVTEPLEHCGCHNSRTTGLSESRMKVVKKTILGGEVSSRIDQVAQKLGSTIRQVEINYSNHYLLNLTRNRTARGKKILAEETWNKRGPLRPRTTTSFYSEKPKIPLVTQVKNVSTVKAETKASKTSKTSSENENVSCR